MYSVIVADPPWKYGDKKLNRGGAERYYRTMDVEDIKSINVQNFAAPDSICLLWATAPLLKEGIDVLESWGFKYKTVAFVWVKRSSKFWENLAKALRKDIKEHHELYIEQGKTPYSSSALKGWFGAKWIKGHAEDRFFMGMGYYTRSNAEFVLLGVKGKAASLIDDHGVGQVIDSCVGKHSAKPQEFFDKAELLTSTHRDKLELFGRTHRDGWHSLGDQIDSGATYYLDDDFNIHLTQMRKTA